MTEENKQEPVQTEPAKPRRTRSTKKQDEQQAEVKAAAVQEPAQAVVEPEKGPEPEAGANQEKGPEPEAGADQEKGPEPEAGANQEKGPEPEAGADQEKGPEPEAGADQEKGPEPEAGANQEKGPEPEAGANQEKGPEPEAGAEQEKGPEPEADAKQDKPALKPNQLRVFNKGRASFCHVSGQTIPANKTVVLSYQDAAKKARAANNFKQLNGLAGHVRFQVEG